MLHDPFMRKKKIMINSIGWIENIKLWCSKPTDNEFDLQAGYCITLSQLGMMKNKKVGSLISLVGLGIFLCCLLFKEGLYILWRHICWNILLISGDFIVNHGLFCFLCFFYSR